MAIYIASDHRGFKLKKFIIETLKEQGYEMVDLGPEEYDESDDFPDYAAKVAEKVSREYETARGILICSSGVGMSVTANKFPRIRAVLAISSDQAYDSRSHNDTNILALAADYLEPEEAKKISLTWLSTPYEGAERFNRRLQKISDIERDNVRRG